MIYSISEIIAKAGTFASEDEQIAYLQQNTSIPLRQVLRAKYDPKIEFLIPNTPPPWKKNSYIGVEGMLYKETRRLKIFIKGGGYDNMNQTKREQLFISLLEDIDNNDADMLCVLISDKDFPNITTNVAMSAFPEDYKD